MVVTEGGIIGTLGGGNVEFQAIALSLTLSRKGRGDQTTKRFALGPSLGQCCGGVMDLSFEQIDSEKLALLQAKQDVACKPVALFGGGHVGRAIANVLVTLPYRVTWIDSRDEIFPSNVSSKIVCEHSDPVESAVASLAAGSAALAMSFSHAEDL